MRVIGTSGHIDHGKSSLIAALTGTHPDRLKEEQAREMTIELGFGWMTLPSGEEIGIVDVPGHRDFIENMLSGIGGIDAALLIIAADEGVMPQTREHLAILDLLQIPAGVIVITKIDLVSDLDPKGESAWLDLVETDIRGIVAKTVLREAPIVRVSAKTREGLDILIETISRMLADKPARLDLSRPRLPIDRVFSMSGFGTVVTGTLSDGQLSVGDEVEVLPAGQKGRIRGLQTHRKMEQHAVPGSRTAVNITGIETNLIQRGDVLVHPGQYHSTRRIDAQVRLLTDITSSLAHRDEVKFFVGACESIAALRLLGTDELKPGQEGWVQLELRDPIVTVRGDRFILRRPSPGETLGGGMIVEPQPKGRHKRFDEGVLKSLSSLAQGTPTDILFEAALGLYAASLRDLVAKSHLEISNAREALNNLLKSGQLLLLEEGDAEISADLLVVTRSHWDQMKQRVEILLNSFHGQFPLRRGVPREELKSKLNLPSRQFNALIRKFNEYGLLNDQGGVIRAQGFAIKFSPVEQTQVQTLIRRFEQNPYNTPSVKECQAEVGEEVLNALIEMGQLIAVSPEVIFRNQDFDAMVSGVRNALEQRGKITLAEVRDLFKTTRKYAQALLEHLDANGTTVRDSDFRKLRK
ncbi:MAG: selenocysteine-specific translation elongation factor [Anaerolineaceae bacterium]|nr:selenocysteine-specific translation elongation factor [Anaerolineaceae bacterium]